MLPDVRSLFTSDKEGEEALMAMFEVRSLSKNFGGLTAISELDLEVEQSEIRGVIGPNGAGKTTLFNVISGVYRPTKGKIIYQ